jgi:CBS domain-containing protein
MRDGGIPRSRDPRRWADAAASVDSRSHECPGRAGAPALTGERVRDAMVAAPRVIDADARATEAGEALARAEVRAVIVCDDAGRLVGIVTRKTLVREVVAAGLDPGEVRLREIAEEPHLTLDADLPLEQGFRLLEERDLERVPVLEDDRFVGVLSRGVVQRRLAEDEDEDEGDDGPAAEAQQQV